MRALVLVALCLVPACHSQPLGILPDGGPADLAGAGGADAAGADGGGKVCTVLCLRGLDCCDGQCVNLMNDIHNCGGCGVVCSGPQPYCAASCVVAPCEPPCSDGQLCCDVRGPGPERGPACTTPTASGTCPPGQPGI